VAELTDVNILLIERIERIVEILQENSIKMGQLLAVHNEKLMKQDHTDGVLFEKIDSVHREVTRKADEIKKGCEKDIMLVDTRLRTMEKKNLVIIWRNRFSLLPCQCPRSKYSKEYYYSCSHRSS